MAHVLTSLRLLLAVPVAVGLARPEFMSGPLLVTCISVAIATDFLDGVVARRMGTTSPRGRLFDHTTDFLFVTSGLGGAASAELVPLALPVLVVAAFTQYVVDSYWLDRQKQLRMSRLGRVNGILYFVPIVLLALSRLSAPGFASVGRLVVPVAYALVVSTLVSIVDRAVAPGTKR